MDQHKQEKTKPDQPCINEQLHIAEQKCLAQNDRDHARYIGFRT